MIGVEVVGSVLNPPCDSFKCSHNLPLLHTVKQEFHITTTECHQIELDKVKN